MGLVQQKIRNEEDRDVEQEIAIGLLTEAMPFILRGKVPDRHAIGPYCRNHLLGFRGCNGRIVQSLHDQKRLRGIRSRNARTLGWRSSPYSTRRKSRRQSAVRSRKLTRFEGPTISTAQRVGIWMEERTNKVERTNPSPQHRWNHIPNGNLRFLVECLGTKASVGDKDDVKFEDQLNDVVMALVKVALDVARPPRSLTKKPSARRTGTSPQNRRDVGGESVQQVFTWSS